MIQSFEQFVNEAKKQTKPDHKKAKAKLKKPMAKKKDQDGDGDSDFADAKIAQYKAGGMAPDKAVAASRKFNK